MKRVSTHELKQELASVIAEAEAGQEILITRHNKPVVRLISARDQHLHRGNRFGTGELKPVLAGKTKGRYLAILREDRNKDE
ncbi:MAG: type II toxin-antitoxin system prevent-host-death family antitoxin [Acidobacteria bacterium]|nr:MAG: type II toxin-antitoxin system prevent-host-death family antitoxin [Acidobacteriota bacterium]